MRAAGVRRRVPRRQPVLAPPCPSAHVRAPPPPPDSAPQLGKRLEDRDIDISATQAALDHILKESYNPSYGARPMRRYIEKHLATDLSRLVIGGKLPDQSVVEVGATAAGFTYKVTPKAAMAQ